MTTFHNKGFLLIAAEFSSCTTHGVTKRTIRGKASSRYAYTFYLRHSGTYPGMETNLVIK